MKLRRRTAGIALALGAAVASIVPIQAAVADSSPPDPYFSFSAQQAQLVARGAAVSVPVRVTCFPETFNFGLQIQVTQRVGGGRIASGFGQVAASSCNGFPQTVVVTVPSSSGSAFKTGTALAQTSAFACTPLQCASFDETKEIAVRK